MIDRYFACRDCKNYVCAGDRWAYWTLEVTGIVVTGEPISVKSVLAAEKYWNIPDDEMSNFYHDGVFPSVREFFQEHDHHEIIYGDKDDFLFLAGDDYWRDYFEWMQVGFLARPSPRSFAEQLNLRTWDEACDYVAKLNDDLWWMRDEKMSKLAKRKFEEVVSAKGAS